MTNLDNIKLEGKFTKKIYEGYRNNLWLFKTKNKQEILLSVHRIITVEKSVYYDISARLYVFRRKNNEGIELFDNNVELINIKESEHQPEKAKEINANKKETDIYG